MCTWKSAMKTNKKKKIEFSVVNFESKTSLGFLNCQLKGYVWIQFKSKSDKLGNNFIV